MHGGDPAERLLGLASDAEPERRTQDRPRPLDEAMALDEPGAEGERAAIAGIGKAPGNTPIYAVTIALTVIGVVAFLAVLLRAI